MPQAGPKTKTRGLRRLKSLLQKWWHKHGGEGNRSSFLAFALLLGGAQYIARAGASQAHSEGSADDIDTGISIVQKLWLKALTGAANKQSCALIDDCRGLLQQQQLQKDFLAIAKSAEMEPLFASPLCPSFIYEAFSFSERRASNDKLQEGREQLERAHLIAFTQVYTPVWVVDHLLHNTLTPRLKQSADTLERVTLLDPAVGGGVFLVQALELFAGAYRARGESLPDAAGFALQHNLYGADIDGTALSTAALCLILKCFAMGLSADEIERILPAANLQLVEDKDAEENQFTLGSLNRDLRLSKEHILGRSYDVVVANPPYLGRKLLPRPLKEKLKVQYPEASSDMSQAFLSLALDLAKPGGAVGFITQSSLLHLPSGRALRQRILQENKLIEVVELGAGVFPMLAGEKASAALVTIETGTPSADQQGRFLSLTGEINKSEFLVMPQNHNCIVRKQSEFLQGDCTISYGRPLVVDTLRQCLAKLVDMAALKQGLATTNNARFLRYVWEVPASEIGGRYVPYARGEGGERWWSPPVTMVLWEDNGRAIKEAVSEAYPYLKGKYAWVVKNEDSYFKAGLTFSFVSKDRLAVRKLPAGAIFDVGSSAIFLPANAAQNDENALLAYLNSKLATAMAHDINPTINFQVGDLKKLVVPKFSSAAKARLAALAASCIEAKQKLYALSDARHFFTGSKNDTAPPTVSKDDFARKAHQFDEALKQLQQSESEIDSIAMEAMLSQLDLSPEDAAQITAFVERPTPDDRPAFGRKEYCRLALVRSLLCLLCQSDSVSGNSMAVLAALAGEGDGERFIAALPGKFDLTFLRDHLCAGRNLGTGIREELPRALDEQFAGQPPIVCSELNQIMLLVPLHQWCREKITELGNVAAARDSARQTAQLIENQVNLGTRAKEIRRLVLERPLPAPSQI